MELDTKQKVLMTIYAEYQKDIPEMDKAINPGELKMNPDAFAVAIDKLQNEELITDARIVHGGNSPIPLMVFTDDIKMTRSGIDYVEQKAGIEGTMTGEQKVKSLTGKMLEWGWEQFKDIAAKTMAEMSKV